MLLDLMSASPSASACSVDEIPLHAELRWTTRGALTFDVTSLARRVDLPAQNLATPPAASALAQGPPPHEPAALFVQRAELVAFRNAPVDVPLPLRDTGAPPPDSGLVLVNSSDELRVAWIDGVPVAWVGPGERINLTTLLRGRYALQWRTFLGDGWEGSDVVVAPGYVEVGGGRP
jgi:hypothetical protein